MLGRRVLSAVLLQEETLKFLKAGQTGTLTGAKILSQNGGTCTVQASDWEYISVSDSRGNVTVTPVEGKTGRVSFETVAGETYTLTESTEAPVPPETDEFRITGDR